MTQKINAILIDERDNVVTVKEQMAPGDEAVFESDSVINQVTVTENIPQFHKIAIQDISKNQIVYKYGQRIGEATRPILKGQHVHEHNIVSPS